MPGAKVTATMLTSDSDSSTSIGETICQYVHQVSFASISNAQIPPDKHHWPETVCKLQHKLGYVPVHAPEQIFMHMEVTICAE